MANSPKVVAKPAGRSFLSDLASAGAGFASGLKKEKERAKQEQIDTAMREFSKQMQVEQLGLERDRYGLAVQGQISQNDAQAAAEADRLLGRQLQERELGVMRDRYKQDAENARLDREMKIAQHKAEIAAKYADIASNERIRNFAAADGGTREVVNSLNTLVDNYKGQITDFINQNPDIADARFQPTNTIERLSAQLASMKPGTPQFNSVQDKVNKVKELQRMVSERQAAMDQLRDVVMKGKDLRMQAGMPDAGDDATVERRWKDYSPEEKTATLQALSAHLAAKAANNEQPNYDKWLDIGITPAELEAARRNAGLGVVVPPEAAASQTPGQHPMARAVGAVGGALGSAGSALGSLFNSAPPNAANQQAIPQSEKPGLAPPLPPPGASVPLNIPSQRSGMLGGVPTPSPTLPLGMRQSSPFATDSSKHRILRPRL